MDIFLHCQPNLVTTLLGQLIASICCGSYDQAILRPGRFDRHILIDLPTLAERKEIFEIYLQKLRLARPVPDYSGNLAHLSPSMSGIDNASLCKEPKFTNTFH